jgi:excisionase family DNA binding protein
VTFEETLRETLREVVREELRPVLEQLRAGVPAPSPAPGPLSVAEAATLAHRNPETIRRAIKSGALRARRPQGGRAWVIDGAELHRWAGGGAAAVGLDMDREVENAVRKARGCR